MSREASLLAKLIKEWANKEWPDLFVKIEHSPSLRYKEWVQLSIRNEWTVVDILYETNSISYRVMPCYVNSLTDPNEDGDDIWVEATLYPADPQYFEKLSEFVRSSLALTEQSIKNEKRLKNGFLQTS